MTDYETRQIIKDLCNPSKDVVSYLYDFHNVKKIKHVYTLGINKQKENINDECTTTK